MTNIDGKIDKLRQLILHQFKEVRKENKEAICNLKKEILEKIEEKSGEMREIIDENEKEAEERILEVQRKMENVLVPIEDILEDNRLKLEEIQLEMNKIGEKVGISTEIEQIHNPIRKEILGKWKMAKFENMEVAQRKNVRVNELNETLEFQIVDGKLQERVNGITVWKEDKLQVEGNHLKSDLTPNSTIDRFVNDGKLYRIHTVCGRTFEEVYRRTPRDTIPIREAIVGEWTCRDDGSTSLKFDVLPDGKLIETTKNDGEYKEMFVEGDCVITEFEDGKRVRRTVDYEWLYECSGYNGKTDRTVVYGRIK